MSRIENFRDVVALWGSPEAMASAIGVKVEAVRKWRQRDSIPSEYWLRIVESAKSTDKPITADDLARLAARGEEPCAPQETAGAETSLG
jgi:hypothetical protein